MVPLIDELPGDSEAMQRLRSDIELAAGTTVPVLLLGESGSGKDHAAHLIHYLSNRREHPFVTLNMAALPATLASAELIGYVKGAFTGADRNRAGLLETAHGGTILLDEIGEADLDLQALILSVLEAGSIRRLGETVARNLDVRVISATNRDLIALTETGSFRADLLNRLSTIKITIPPLRDRKAEIPILALRSLDKISIRVGKVFELTPDAVAALKNYNFPGNFRELQNVLERAVFTAAGSAINARALGLPTTARLPRRFLRASPKLEAAQQQISSLKRELNSLRVRSIVAQPIWQGRGFATQHDYCFVLMPFGAMRDLQTIYHDHVKPIIERCGLRCERADDIYDVSGVMQSVWEGINKARIVVADLTERNANVFYELGIAHTLGKPVIMLSQSIDFVPFDLRHLRSIIYTYTPPGATKLEQALERTIKTVLSTSADLG
jgi:MoxR-like ATPase